MLNWYSVAIATVWLGSWEENDLFSPAKVAKLSLLKKAAAATAKSLQLCPTLYDPHRRQPTRLLCPWDSPSKNTGVGCHFLLQCRKVKSESEVAQSCPTLSDPMDCSPPGSSVPRILQARTLEWVAISFSSTWKWKVKVKSLSRVRLLAEGGVISGWLRTSALLKLLDALKLSSAFPERLAKTQIAVPTSRVSHLVD